MKNTIKIMAILALLQLPQLMKSQTTQPYTVYNTNSCDAFIEYKRYNSSCGQIGATTQVTVLANSSITLPIAFDYEITVL